MNKNRKQNGITDKLLEWAFPLPWFNRFRRWLKKLDYQESNLTYRHTFTVSTDEPYSKSKLCLEMLVNYIKSWWSRHSKESRMF